MAVRPDSRITETGRHPDVRPFTVDPRSRGQLLPRNAVRELQDAGRANPEAAVRRYHDAATTNFASIEDAADTLGLPAEQARQARQFLSEIVSDARDLLSVSKSAIEAGMPRAAVSELIRRGIVLKNRFDREMDVVKGAALPEGSEREWGGKTFKKVGGKWRPKGGKHDRAQKETEAADPKAKAKAQRVAGQMKAQSEQQKAEAGKLSDPEVRARFRALKERAAKVGIKVNGTLRGDHTHEHMDALEGKITAHEKAATKHNPAEAPEPPGDQKAEEGKDKPGEAAPQAPGGGEPREGLDEPHGTDVPGKHEPHETHRLQNLVHEMQTALENTRSRAKTDGEKAMIDQLVEEGEAIAKKPSPQAVQWHQSRVTSFLKVLLGAAAGAALGTDVLGGAGAGAVEGEASKVDVQTAEKVMGEAQEAAQEGDQGKKDEEPPEKADKEVKKGGLLIDLRTGLFYKSDAVRPDLPLPPPPPVVLPPPPPPPDPQALRKSTIAVRAPRPVNEFGHRDDLTPGQTLFPRKRHETLGPVTVLDEGQFQVGGDVFKSATAMLDHLHGGPGHNTTVRRYFRLGGERKARQGGEAFDRLRPLMKARGVVVQRRPDGQIGLIGADSLVKADVPLHMLPREDARQTTIDPDVALDLVAALERLS